MNTNHISEARSRVCAGDGNAATPGAANWLGFAASPTCAVMALWTGFSTSLSDMPCMSGHGGLPLNGGDVRADEPISCGAVAVATKVLDPARRLPLAHSQVFIQCCRLGGMTMSQKASGGCHLASTVIAAQHEPPP